MTPFALSLALLATPSGEVNHAPAPAVELQLDYAALDQAGRDAQDRHMWRLVAWSGVQIAVGGGMVATGLVADSIESWGFGGQLLGWGVIDLAIAGAGLAFAPAPTEDRAELVERELFWGDVLLVNAGLDVGYVLVGATLVTLGLLGAPFAPHLVGHGLAVMIAGSGLFALDVWAFAEGVGRRRELAVGKPAEVAAAPATESRGGSRPR